jgi:hypothetical protein
MDEEDGRGGGASESGLKVGVIVVLPRRESIAMDVLMRPNS